VPAFEEMVQPMDLVLFDMSEIETMAFKEIRLDEKRSIKRPALIRKKLLVKR
jgi:hypothetical protein